MSSYLQRAQITIQVLSLNGLNDEKLIRRQLSKGRDVEHGDIQPVIL